MTEPKGRGDAWTEERATREGAASERAPEAIEESTALLALRGLTVERGRRAVVRDVSIEIPAGEITALLGPNGAGKSSLVLAVGGVLRLQAGSVLLDGLDWANRRPERIRRAGIAVVPEGRRLLPDLTVEDNIRVATYSLSADQARAGRDRALELFPEISRRLSAPARMLSGGEQQMVVLAQALVSQPRYMLIDELSLGLAPVVVNRLIPAIRAVAESGVGVLLIEQFATVALGLANRTHIMESGQLRFSGLARELRAKPELLRSAYLLRGSNSAASRPTTQGRSEPEGRGAAWTEERGTSDEGRRGLKGAPEASGKQGAS
jgi:branched-chain amino acid transport system ATP-binding protein